MDGKRFDALSRSVAAPATRRTALGGMVASGLLAAFGIKQAPAVAQEPATCVIDFAATVRQGPTANQELRGELSFGLSGKGNLENATLRLADGTSVPVVGQATGHALQMRLQLAANQPLIAIGVGEQEIAACQGAIDGLVTGPAAGDLGDFHAVVVRSTGDLGGGGDDAGGGQKKDKKNAGQQQGAASGGTASGGAASGGGGGDQKADKKDKKANNKQQTAGAGGTNAGGTQAQGTDTGGATDSGAATTPCDSGLMRCGDACVNLSSDMNHCGACGSVCESSLVPVECRGGVCERANCPVGITYCGIVDGCRDLASDRDHCGACANSCGDGACVNGACQAAQPQTGTCEQGLTDCGGVCVNTMTDPANCGSCGSACPAGNECSDGACIAPAAPPTDNCVPQGLTACAGFCVNTATDAAHCGACGAACAAGESCAGGVCQAAAAPQAAACAAGETDCGGVCVDLSSDFGNCGACGVVCVAPQGCNGGQCVDQTAPPPTNCAAIGPTFIDCGGVCVDAQIDTNNCGGCGVVCQNQCAAGVCA